MSNKSEITATDIKKLLPPEFLYVLKIVAPPLPQYFEPVISAFCIAANKIISVAMIRRPITIVFGKSPFNISLTSGDLSYHPRIDVINACIENFVFIDCAKILPMPLEIQIATILEELVHAIMNVSDERLTSQIVALIYDGVHLVQGKYDVAKREEVDHK